MFSDLLVNFDSVIVIVKEVRIVTLLGVQLFKKLLSSLSIFDAKFPLRHNRPLLGFTGDLQPPLGFLNLHLRRLRCKEFPDLRQHSFIFTLLFLLLKF